MLATFIGITPGTLLYGWVARSFDNLLSQGQKPDLSVMSEPAVILPLLTLGLLSLIPVLWKSIRAHQPLPNPENTHNDAPNKVEKG